MIKTYKNKKRNFSGVGFLSQNFKGKIHTWPGASSRWPMIGHLIRGEKKSSELDKDIRKEKPLL